MKSLFLNLVLAIGLSVPGLLYAQDNQYAGLILDTETNQPVPYAHIYRAEDSGGATSNSSGIFTYQSTGSGSFRLIISAVGYDKKTISSNHLIQGEHLKIPIESALYQSEPAVVTASSFSSFR